MHFRLFTDGGSVQLDLNAYDCEFTIQWIDISTGQWGGEHMLNGGAAATIAAPAAGGWVAAIVKVPRGANREGSEQPF